MVSSMPTLSGAQLTTTLAQIKARHGGAPWHERVIITDEFTLTVICQPARHPNDRHYHIRDECWFVAEGEISWTFEGGTVVHARAGDFVFAPKHTFHLIQPAGDGPSIRVAVSVTGEPHRHERPPAASA